jgi:hypothetical protein
MKITPPKETALKEIKEKIFRPKKVMRGQRLQAQWVFVIQKSSRRSCHT